MYYGGEPAAWVATPPIPTGALYTGSDPTPPEATAAPASADGEQGGRVVTRVIKVPKHPLAELGGCVE